MSDVTGCIVTPSCDRRTLPSLAELVHDVARHVRRNREADPDVAVAVFDRICELMPTSSPFVLTSAPPELPWLIGASVCRKSS